jgi:hypothetical protein
MKKTNTEKCMEYRRRRKAHNFEQQEENTRLKSLLEEERQHYNAKINNLQSVQHEERKSANQKIGTLEFEIELQRYGSQQMQENLRLQKDEIIHQLTEQLYQANQEICNLKNASIRQNLCARPTI